MDELHAGSEVSQSGVDWKKAYATRRVDSSAGRNSLENELSRVQHLDRMRALSVNLITGTSDPALRMFGGPNIQDNIAPMLRDPRRFTLPSGIQEELTKEAKALLQESDIKKPWFTTNFWKSVSEQYKDYRTAEVRADLGDAFDARYPEFPPTPRETDLDDVSQVGEHKPLGYVNASMLPDGFEQQLLDRGLQTYRKPVRTDIRSDTFNDEHVYFYDSAALQELLNFYLPVLTYYHVPAKAEEFVPFVANMAVEPGEIVYDVIADAFANHANRNERDQFQHVWTHDRPIIMKREDQSKLTNLLRMKPHTRVTTHV